MDIAFALGGLGGNNAHGAGFLQAALNAGAGAGAGAGGPLRPKMISCTSGQLLWVYRYLASLGQPEFRPGKDRSLRDQFERDLASMQPTGDPNLDLLHFALWGKKDVFRPPSGAQYLADMMHNAAQVLNDAIAANGKVMALTAWLSLFPSRLAVPQFPASFFGEIARAFQESPIGIAFNSYNPRSGLEHVHLNEAARDFLQQKNPDRGAYEPAHASRHRPHRVYQDADARGVRDALWLYPYGFDEKVTGFLDGAYFRGVMLSELTPADLIFSVRPIHHKWQGRLPSNYPELEDLKTEVSFNGAYSAERNQILLINKLVEQGALSGPAAGRYHRVDLEEIEIGMQRGYLDYLVESMDVFDHAEKESAERFKPHVEPGSGARAKTARRLTSVRTGAARKVA